MKVVTSLTFDKIKEIGGEGANSKAYLAYDNQLDAQIVVKSILKTDFKDKDSYFNESKILYSANHPNIMEIQYACQDNDCIYLSMPYYKNGSLNSLINSRFLTVREIIKYALDFLEGLHYIHTKRLIHFDVKPTNIIINDSLKAILTDFGLSKYADVNGFATPDKVYPSHWVPEAFLTTDLTSQYDIYQAGLTLYRMCNGNEDFNDQKRLVTNSTDIMRGRFPVRNRSLPHIPNKLQNCIRKSLFVDNDKRYKTVLDLMNDLSLVNENLDWFYNKDNGNEIWSIENESNIKKITLAENNHKWLITGENYNKSSKKTSKINKWSDSANTKEDSYQKIRLFIQNS